MLYNQRCGNIQLHFPDNVHVSGAGGRRLHGGGGGGGSAPRGPVPVTPHAGTTRTTATVYEQTRTLHNYRASAQDNAVTCACLC
ncbi:hypothetical protein JYU34_011033 [Plutella xylostella]|uniref:Uncharacterized protein n=1 Tax=Plutella xylostella TaxID=51655 RepID=A0ABQ7QFV7_PLUXY|nr:hypothetical protein JYU34_011033 [Plutella xylostella]